MNNDLKHFKAWKNDYYYDNRPVEPYSESDNAEQWARIAFYTEDKLQEAFMAGQKTYQIVNNTIPQKILSCI